MKNQASNMPCLDRNVSPYVSFEKTPHREDIRNESPEPPSADIDTLMKTVNEIVETMEQGTSAATTPINVTPPTMPIGKKQISFKRSHSKSDDMKSSKKKRPTLTDLAKTDIHEETEKEKQKKSSVAKIRGPYRKLKIDKAVPITHHIKQVTFEQQNQIINSATDLIRENTSQINELYGNQYTDDRRFTDCISSTYYYMFIVCEDNNNGNVYKIHYVNCVARVTVEYAARYSCIDNYVMVVSINNHRFMISYNLLKKLNVKIPKSEDFNESSKNKNKCQFNEVKDIDFMATLINMFHLDICYVQSNMMLMLAALGPSKAPFIADRLYYMINQSVIFNLPINLAIKESQSTENVDDISAYVQEIMKYSAKAKFETLKHGEIGMDKIVKHVDMWFNNKKDKTWPFFFTYKYGSVVRIFYNKNDDSFNKLLKVKNRKENNGVNLIETYLNSSVNSDTSENFILINVKADERITIIKKGKKYVWISTVCKEINVLDIISKFRRFRHHIFDVSCVARKELNNTHNAMITLASFYVKNVISSKQAEEIASQKFNVKYRSKNYE
ncbi:ie-1 [Cryptophlebia peltastica nucleopolyhedrovirus]|uniref:Ie-1 n=1 Tax=Cryptophlebia peltastica nucleopolyhedrovirus TaxID=2304025 RepID=A0A346RNP2_9ABAC|nr:ie-1 [Cryptophlebia peltastica nucleopolyhedrovirus]AXS67689.1 ie-1 [Cryptophlebia peltastica nucleopolyhedrovirus]